nr:HNH endonuclease [uncultured Flavobacterium sp.]
MARLIRLSNISWKQPFKDRKKELHLWNTETEVASFCSLKNETKRLLNIRFEDRFNIDITQEFQITSLTQIYFPKDLQDKIQKIIFNNPESYFTVTVLDTSQTLYTPSDIKWFKSVTNEELGEAYLDFDENNFILSFPNKHRTNALTPNIDDIILIYQKVNGIPAFTHLVTPVNDELIDSARINYRYGRRVKIIAKTNRNNYINVSSTLWRKVKLSGVTQGNACKIENIGSADNIDELQLNIWEWFKNHFVPSEQQSEAITSSIIKELEITNPDLTAKEGELKLITHIIKERNRTIVIEKKRQAIKNNILKCEVCSFSFPEIYQSNFIECHHITPIAQSEGVIETRLEDLALVCANCHRMLHTKFNGLYLSIEELQIRIQNIGSQ